MNRLSAPLKCIQLDKKGKVVSETMIETPFARIELANKNVAKIRRQLKTILSQGEIPKFFFFEDTLPVNESGKVLKRLLE